MLLEIEMVSVEEHSYDVLTKLDQLTIVRNQVRKELAAHRKDANGEKVEQIKVDVAWLDGNVETLIFDTLVGFPIEPERDWYEDWRKEVLGK